MVCKAAKRTPSRRDPARSTGASPVSAAWQSAASETLRHSGPTVSNRAARGTTPSSEIRPAVVLSPTRSFHAAGMRTDPPVSDPMAAAASPKATEAAAPEDDPPGTALASFTQGGVCMTGFRPRPENANSDMWVLPRQTRPSRVAVCRQGASSAGTRPSSRRDPASVTMPAVSNRSFQLMGTPSSGDRRCPRAARSRAARASNRARSGVTRA